MQMYHNKVCTHLCVVQELEVCGLARCLFHRLCQLQTATPTLRPVLTGHGVRCAALFRYLADEINLCRSVGPDIRKESHKHLWFIRTKDAHTLHEGNIGDGGKASSLPEGIESHDDRYSKQLCNLDLLP